MLNAKAELCSTRTIVKTIFLLAFVCTTVFAQAPAPGVPGVSAVSVAPLPQDTGASGLQEVLRHLQNTGRLMMVTAHPDDEDGGVLTLESRGRGVHALLMTLTRGEGGQNELGTGLFNKLGVIRTLELLASDRYYGVEQRFSRAADFGFSKTPEETLQKWGGQDVPLADLVRVIRTFRPDVLIARFSGTPRDGHGHHQASAILTKEAFRAAGDPTRFPEQIKEGLQPWQPKKLYIGNVCPWRASTCPDEDWSVRLDTGEVDPVLGTSYLQMAMNGLAHQRTQGHFDFTVSPGPHYAFYKLVDSVLPKSTDASGHEKDFFDGIDTSLAGLAKGSQNRLLAAELFGFEGGTLATAQNDLSQALRSEPSNAVPLLLQAQHIVRTIAAKLLASDNIRTDGTPAGIGASDAEQRLSEEESGLEDAIERAAGISFKVTMQKASGSKAPPVVIPGEQFDVTAALAGPGEVQQISLDLPPGWKSKIVSARHAGAASATFRITVPKDPQFTRPYWHRSDPLSGGVNTIDNPAYQTLPFAPPFLLARADYSVNGQTERTAAVATANWTGPDGKTVEEPIAVVPAFSVRLQPAEQILPAHSSAAMKVEAEIRPALDEKTSGKLRLQGPAAWKIEPAEHHVAAGPGDDASFQFAVQPRGQGEDKVMLHALLDSKGNKFSESYTLVGRPDIGFYYYYQPAVQRVSIVDVKVPKGLKVAYIQGAGEDTPTVLQQVGMNVTVLPPEKIATEDLSQFGTLVLGVRAYDAQKDVVANNAKLLKFVENGGTLVVEHNNDTFDFNSGHFTPYPAELGRARVAVEEAPVKILAPENPIFHYPNEITQKDFDGWVQERGLYFMSSWDKHFTPLLECHDPNEPEQKGGLLMAKYGKGTYIYSGYSFYRELPAGVPGAVRLFVNLVSAGHEPAASSEP